MTSTYNRDEVVAFWRSTGLENKRKRREIEKLAQLTGSHVDHIKPLRAGGPDLWFNLQVLSGTRNTSKGANFPELDQREYQKRWSALPDDYQVAVQAAIDGNPLPVPNFFQRVTRRNDSKSKLPKRGTIARFIWEQDKEHKALMATPAYRDLLQTPEAKEAIADSAQYAPKGKRHGIGMTFTALALFGTGFSLMGLLGLTDRTSRELALQMLTFTVPAAVVGVAGSLKEAGKSIDARDRAQALGIHLNDIPV